jgi:hypothetical protein
LVEAKTAVLKGVTIGLCGYAYTNISGKKQALLFLGRIFEAVGEIAGKKYLFSSLFVSSDKD